MYKKYLVALFIAISSRGGCGAARPNTEFKSELKSL